MLSCGFPGAHGNAEAAAAVPLMPASRRTPTHLKRTQAQLRAAAALRGLSVDEDLRTQIVARGGLVPLLRLSSSDDVEIQMEVHLVMRK